MYIYICIKHKWLDHNNESHESLLFGKVGVFSGNSHENDLGSRRFLGANSPALPVDGNQKSGIHSPVEVGI